MKKFLSIALSTAMAFSMFASVAFGAEKELTTQDKYDALTKAGIFEGFKDGTAGLEQNMTRAQFAKVVAKLLTLEDDAATATSKYVDVKANNWAAPFIGSVSKAGLMEGSKNQKGQVAFDFNGNVTVEQMAKVLVIALKLEVPATAENGASAWAKGYVDAAVKAGLIPADANFKAAATREQLVIAAYTASVEIEKAKVSYEVKVVDANNIEVTFSDAKDKPESFKLEKALEANKENTVTVKRANGEEKTLKFTWTITDASKVESVKADNLKEVVVTFDGEVDKTTATIKENYLLETGKVKSVSLSDDKKVATLVLDEGLTNQEANKLTVRGIKAGTKTIEQKDIAFTPVDAVIPTVAKVESLGTKAIKITFSEPIKNTEAGSFNLDGKAFYGQPQVDSREVTLVSYDALTVGEHTLTIAGAEDYAGFKSLAAEKKFTVVEDKAAPTIAEATATLETLTVTFSEDIDPDTVSADNVYFKSGDSKITAASFSKVSGNKYEFNFKNSDKLLPSYETLVYVEGVKDYSGNEIKETSKLVNAKVDQTRPTVIDVRTNDDFKSFTIKFSKAVKTDGVNFEDFIKVLDKDSKVRSIASVVADSDDSSKLIVTMNEALPAGTNKVSIKGIKDTTVLENVMLDYETTISVGDIEKPKFDSASVNFDASSNIRRVIVTFNERMDASTLANRANYIVKFKGTERTLPSDAKLTVTNDSKSVIIDLPKKIGNEDVTLANVDYVKVYSVTDVAGNVLDGFVKQVDVADYQTAHLVKVDSDYPTFLAQATDKKTIELKFNQSIAKASKTDFDVKVNGVSVGISSVSTNNDSSVKIKLSADLATTDTADVSVVINNNNAVQTVAGTKGVQSETVASVLDKVAPEVVVPNNGVYNVVKVAEVPALNGVTGATYAVAVPFSEAITGAAGYLASDLVVTRQFDSKTIKAGTDFGAVVDGNILYVTINDAANAGKSSIYKVEVKAGSYISDNGVGAVKNKVKAKSGINSAAKITLP